MRSMTLHIYDSHRSIYRPVVVARDSSGRISREITHSPAEIYATVDGQPVPLATLIACYKTRNEGK